MAKVDGMVEEYTIYRKWIDKKDAKSIWPVNEMTEEKSSIRFQRLKNLTDDLTQDQIDQMVKDNASYEPEIRVILNEKTP